MDWKQGGKRCLSNPRETRYDGGFYCVTPLCLTQSRGLNRLPTGHGEKEATGEEGGEAVCRNRRRSSSGTHASTT